MAGRADQDRLSISQVSERLGIPVPTIRSWERRYDFPSPARTEGRHRRYSPDEIDRLRSLRDEITRGHPARKAVELVRSGGRDVARSEFLDRFTDAARALDVDGVRRSLDQAVEMVGVERAIVEVTMPGMRELGDQWQSGLLRRRDGTCGDRRRAAVVRSLERGDAAAVPLATIGPGDRAHRTPHDRPGGLRGPARQAWVADPHARRAHPHGCSRHRAHVLPSRRDDRHRPAQRRAARSDREPSCGRIASRVAASSSRVTRSRRHDPARACPARTSEPTSWPRPSSSVR